MENILKKERLTTITVSMSQKRLMNANVQFLTVFYENSIHIKLVNNY